MKFKRPARPCKRCHKLVPVTRRHRCGPGYSVSWPAYAARSIPAPFSRTGQRLARNPR
jgi:hypothetical protein